MINTCNSSLLIDDYKVRVTRFDFLANQQTGWHKHTLDYLITTITDCHLRLESPDGNITEVTVQSGSVYKREAGVEHNVINVGCLPMSFIEVELK